MRCVRIIACAVARGWSTPIECGASVMYARIGCVTLRRAPARFSAWSEAIAMAPLFGWESMVPAGARGSPIAIRPVDSVGGGSPVDAEDVGRHDVRDRRLVGPGRWATTMLRCARDVCVIDA